MLYNPEKDLVFFGDVVPSYVQVSPSEFAIFFLEDVHAPGIGNLLYIAESNLNNPYPLVTSAARPTNEIGRTATRLLLDQIESEGIFVPHTVILNGRLNVCEPFKKMI